jgi:hypothetical protein
MATPPATVNSPNHVTLAIYDLSHGLCATLSLPLVGVALPMIPHTGVIIEGVETFFGGGVQRCRHSEFVRMHGIRPVRYVSLGLTTRSSREISEWLVNNRGRYTASTYNLLTNNCNNFAHDFALNCCSMTSGVPDDVLGVPRLFMQSPMGQQMMPWLSNFYAPFAAQTEQVPESLPPALPSGTAPPPAPNLPPSTPNAAPLLVLAGHNKPHLYDATTTIPTCLAQFVKSLPPSSPLASLTPVTILSPLNDDQIAAFMSTLNPTAPSLFFCLSILRIVVLHTVDVPLFTALIGLVPILPNQATQLVGMLTLSNALHSHKQVATKEIGSSISQTLLPFVACESAELRRACVRAMFNFRCPGPLEVDEDDTLEVLLACSNGISEESDEVCVKTRLVIIANIVQSGNGGGLEEKALLVELGVVEVIGELKLAGEGDALRKEVISILTN